jgi:type II secretory pathway pseudopilin PulG
MRALPAALAVIAIVAALALFFASGIPTRQPRSEATEAEHAPPGLGEAVV